MSGRITDLMISGFGQLGQAAGQGVEGYLQQRDWDRLKEANDVQQREQQRLAAQGGQGGQSPEQDPLVQQILGFANQGLSPSEAVARIKANRQQAPQVNVPGLNQGNVVQGAVPMSPAQPLNGLGGLGSSGAPLEYGPEGVPEGPAYRPDLMQHSPEYRPDLMQQGPTRDANFGAPQVVRGQAPMPQPQVRAPVGPSVNRMQQTSRSVAPPQAFQSAVNNAITPRNMALAQFLEQRKQQEALRDQQRRQSELESATRVATTSMQQSGSMDREVVKSQARQELEAFKADARAGIASARIQAALQKFDAENQTDIWQTYQQMAMLREKLRQSDINSQRTLAGKGGKGGGRGGGAGNSELAKLYRDLYKSNSSAIAKLAPFAGVNPLIATVLGETIATNESIRRDIAGIDVEPGEETTTPATPGVKVPLLGEIGGTPAKTTRGPPRGSIRSGGAAQGKTLQERIQEAKNKPK